MRRRAWLAGAFLASGIASGCAWRAAGPRAAPADSGTLYLYLDALPEEAEPLRADISAVDALDANGAPHRLELRLAVLDGAAPRRQRLLAMGTLPAGTYRGIAVSVGSARIAGEHGSGALQTAQEPAPTEAQFAVESQGATVLSLRLQVEASIVQGVRFQPVLTVGPPGVLAAGLFALATSRSDGALVVFHKLQGEVFAVLPTAPAPSGVALEAERQIAYVASSEGDSIDVFDLSRMIRDQRFPVLAGDRPSAVALAPDGRTLVCAHQGSNALGVYDAPVLGERFRIGVGLEPSAVLLDPAGRRAFVLNTGSDTLAVVDVIEGRTERTIATDDGPIFAAFDRTGRRLYVIHRDSPYLAVIPLSRLVVERRVYVGPEASAIAVDPRTDRIFLARRGTRRIEVFDPASLLPVDSIEAGEDVSFLAASGDGDLLYAAVPAVREVRGIRLAGNRIVSVTQLGREPVWITVAGGR